MIISCPICGIANSQRKFEAEDEHCRSPGRWWVRQCRGCESLFLENPPDAESLSRMYPEETYYSYRLAKPNRFKVALQRAVGFSRMRGRPPADVPPGTRLLDFGCGAGDYLLEMRSAGWDVAGVEISATARRIAAEQGLDVRASLYGPEGFEPGSFDYVRANHSLEHVPNPADTVRELVRALRPGGMMFIGAPNAASMNARVFGAKWWHLVAPLHVTVPSLSGIAGLVRASGLEIVRSGTHSDFGGIAGSIQILLNRGHGQAGKGMLLRSPAFRPALLISQWAARLQDLAGAGDMLELLARRPVQVEHT